MDCCRQMMHSRSDRSVHPARKAVILAAGMGTRMRKTDARVSLAAQQDAAASSGLKAMIPFDRPFLDYVLTPLAEAGICEVCLVIGPAHHEIRRYYGRPEISTRLRLSFAIQETPRGTADALLAAREFAGDEPFLVLNSDNYYPLAAIQSLCELQSPGLVGYQRTGMLLGSNITADRLCNFAVIQCDKEGHLEAIIEKPSSEFLATLAEPVLLSMNCWRFDQRIFAACEATQASARGELELPDAVMVSIRDFGVQYAVVPCDQAVLDLSQRSDIQAVATRVAGLAVRL